MVVDVQDQRSPAEGVLAVPETVARRGGIAILPQDIPTEVVATVVAKVKGSHPVYDTPVTVDPVRVSRNHRGVDALAGVPARSCV